MICLEISFDNTQKVDVAHVALRKKCSLACFHSVCYTNFFGLVKAHLQKKSAHQGSIMRHVCPNQGVVSHKHQALCRKRHATVTFPLVCPRMLSCSPIISCDYETVLFADVTHVHENVLVSCQGIRQRRNP